MSASHPMKCNISSWIVALVSNLVVIAMPQDAFASNPVFEPSTCPEEIQATECGYVAVPENRQNAQGKQIRLFVIVVRSEHSNRVSDPVFMLTGGPGESSALYAGVATLYGERDFVTFDQRGVGRSQPALNCPGFDTVQPETSQQPQAAIVCGRQFISEGIDLSAYNTVENAADVNDIRIALGYEKINLIGESYGTRLAQMVMRNFPQVVRSAVLDSVVPPQIDRPAETPRNVEASLRRVFASCAADAGCNARYPNLETVYRQLLQDLDRPTTQNQPFSRADFQAIILASLYTAQGVAELPSLIYSVRNERYPAILTATAVETGQAITEVVTWGMYITTECRGEVAFSRPEALQATYAALPDWRAVFNRLPGISSEQIREVCRAWGLDQPSLSENDPLKSSIPTLLLGGRFDPVLAPDYLALASAGLTHAFTFEFPYQSHVAGLSSLCGVSIVNQFLADPATQPNAGCIQEEQPLNFVLAEADSLTRQGNQQFDAGQHQAAIESFKAALSIVQQEGDRQREGITFLNIAAAYRASEQYPQAMATYEQALARFKATNNRAGEATALSGIGLVYDDQAEYDRALEFYQQGLAIRQALGDRDGEAISLSNIGGVYQIQKRYSEALTTYQQVLMIHRELNDRAEEGRILQQIGWVERLQKHYSQALETYQQALAIRREVGDRDGEASTLNHIGITYRLQKQYPQALAVHQQALTICRAIGDQYGEAITLRNLAAAYRSQEQYSQATDFYKQALAIYQAIGDQEAAQEILSRIQEVNSLPSNQRD